MVTSDRHRPASIDDGALSLDKGFLAPPAVARPFARWWWNGNAVAEAEIIRELAVLKKAGIGGVEINPIEIPYCAQPTDDKSLLWLSEAWGEHIGLAAAHARRLGMVTYLLAGTGWPFGGPFLELEDQVQFVHLKKQMLEGPASFEASIDDLQDTADSPVFALRQPEFRQAPRRLRFLRLVPETPSGPGSELKERVDTDGTVQFEVPAGRHWLYIGTWRRGHRRVGKGAPGGEGPVLDHYSARAVRKYLEHFSDKLKSALGGAIGESFGGPLRALFCDSIELARANWASDLPEEFAKRRGYDIEPYLPFVLDEPVADGEGAFGDTIRRARYDYARTLVDLFHERFIQPFHRWCRENGALSRYQAYGHPWLLGMLEGYMIPDMPEGDTWLFQPIESEYWNLDGIRYAIWNKYASSGAHLTGKPVVSCESMTNLFGVFRETLEYVKQADDLTFMAGVNHSVLHGYNYSPPQVDFPGWLRFGTFFSEHNPWWGYLRRWADYNARVSWVLQQTEPVAQVAILGPTADVWSVHGLERDPYCQTPWYLHLLWQALSQQGFGSDYVNERVVQEARVEAGRMCYGPMAYDVLVVASVRSVEPATAAAIERWVKGGGRVLFVDNAPDRSPGLYEAEVSSEAVRRCIKTALRHSGGRARVVAGPQNRGELLAWAGKALADSGVGPPVQFDQPNERLFQLHQRSGDRRFFFLVNAHREETVSVRARFATGRSIPWRWDPHTGDRAIYPHGGRPDELEIELGPVESLLLVFEPEGESRELELEQRGRSGSQSELSALRVAWDFGDVVPIAGPWTLHCHPVAGETFQHNLPALVDLARDPKLEGFAGVVTYRTEFEVKEVTRIGLSLGRVEGVSEAVLNGQRLGVRWYGRHLYELGDAIRPGRNVLEVTVTTTLFNYCRALTGNAAAQYWVKKSRPGETPDLSPAPVGILGPVQLVGVRRSASSWQIDRSRRARRRAEGTPAGPYRA
jgi:hypothetical protein